MPRRRIAVPLSPWSPAFVLVACLAVGTVAGLVGQRRLAESADAQLLVTGELAANHFSWLLVSRMRALENIALLDAQFTDPDTREAVRTRAVAGLAVRYPEFVWVGFADVPGRVTVAARGLLAGADVSTREWWRAGLRGPFLGDLHEATLLAPSLVRTDNGELPRLLDIAVPLRSADGAPHGVLGAHVDSRWVVQIREELVQIVRPLEGIEMLVLLRDGSTVAGRRFEPDTPLPDQIDPGGLRITGRLDGVPRVVTVHKVAGDVVVARLGWRILVIRDPATHAGAGRRMLAVALAAGVGIGCLAAVAVATMMRRAVLRPRRAP